MNAASTAQIALSTIASQRLPGFNSQASCFSRTFLIFASMLLSFSSRVASRAICVRCQS